MFFNKDSNKCVNGEIVLSDIPIKGCLRAMNLLEIQGDSKNRNPTDIFF